MINNIIKTDKFSTVIFNYKLIFNDNLKDMTYKNLICYMLKNTNKAYPKNYLWNLKLDSLYDADYTVFPSCFGSISAITYQMRFTNPNIINDKEYTMKYLYDFFMETIFNPEMEKGIFNANSFELAKNEMENDLVLKKENKQLQAIMAAQDIYYKDTIGAIHTDGTLEELEKISCEDLSSFYNNLNLKDGVFYVVGDITPTDFKDINNVAYEFDNYFLEKSKNIENKEVIIKTNYNQSTLVMIFDLKVKICDKLNPVAIILNYIFGGSPSSLLFTNLREKHSFCYTVRSFYQNTTGSILVYAGIDSKNYNKSVDLVMNQLKDLQEGNFDDKLITEAILYYKNQTNGNKDNVNYYLQQAFMINTFKYVLTDDMLYESLTKVTKQNIMDLAKDITHELTYFMKSGGKNE